MASNPYTITFGKEPKVIIPRTLQTLSVCEAFDADEPSQQVFMVVGPRGSGKTVFMTEVSRQLKERSSKSWIIVELNPARDLLTSLASKLYGEDRLAAIFANAKLDLSFFGLGLSFKGSAPITDVETALIKMLETLDNNGKRVLISIDEVTNTQAMLEFAGAFQIFLRRGLPVFLLMTGLYQNIYELQNEKSLTFLYRAPKVQLAPLNIGSIARSYKRTFGIDDDKALHMAKLTRGYSFAFQVLGYLTWEHKGLDDEVLDEYRHFLDEYVYDKIWSELSPGDRRLAYGIACAPDESIQSIREFLGIESNQFSPYRVRLIRKGVIDGSTYGKVSFILPFFEDYVREHYGETSYID